MYLVALCYGDANIHKHCLYFGMYLVLTYTEIGHLLPVSILYELSL